MSLADLGKTVAKYAPLLGAVLPVPGGAAIGAAIASVFGGDINNPDDLIKRITTDPESAVKLKQIESNEKIEIERLAIDRIRAGNEDRDSARKREATIHDKVPGQLAYVFTAGYLIIVIIVIMLVKFTDLNNMEEKLCELALMGMSQAEMLILAYFYGASNKRDGI
jgi:hypothetical protein